MGRDRILVVDDEAAVRFGIRDFLEAHGYAVVEACDCKEAEWHFEQSRPDAVIIDYRLPDGDALALLPRLKQFDTTVPIIILTAHGSIELAVRAIKEGAEQFLTKPLELPALLVILARLLENQRNRNQRLASKTREVRDFVDPFIGSSKAIRSLCEQAHKVVGADCPILILGQTGSGKGMLAKWLHKHGARANEAFVDLNCAGLTREFLETELFGHEKGAFTGAVAAKSGLFEVAHHGTVFLDEIGDVDPQVQPKLLKVLEEKRFRRLGAVRDREVDIALLAATHQDLQQLVAEQKFRTDLYFRINTIPLLVPPLRERVEDIPVLHLLERLAQDLGGGEVALAPDAFEALQAHRWPGNVRELRNVLERALLLSEGAVITRGDLCFDRIGALAEPGNTHLTLRELERAHIEAVLKEEGGQVERAARRLGVPRSSLYAKLIKHEIALSKM